MDNGQHVFLRCCTAYLEFLSRIGSAGDIELQDRLEVTVLRPNGVGGSKPERSVIRRDKLRAPLHLARSLVGYKLIPPAERARLGAAVLPLMRMDLGDPSLDDQTFAGWLAAHGQGWAAISELWDLICLPTVNLPAQEASLAMAAKVFQTGLLTDSAAGDIGWSKVPLGELHDQRAMAALRKAGAQVRLSDAVAKIDRTTGAGNGTGSAFTVRATGGELEADAVIVALPHYCTEDLLPAGALSSRVRPSMLTSSPIVNVHVHFDRRVTELAMAAGLGSPAQWIFDRTEPSGATRGQYLAVTISAADRYVGARPEVLADEIVAALRKLFPVAREAKVLSTFVTRERNATFRACPGSAAHRAAPRTQFTGLVLAGAWTSTGWPPTMEGAVRSGVAAARCALVATGQHGALPKVAA
jgi:squalene-associated FAD-dependent desaturase